MPRAALARARRHAHSSRDEAEKAEDFACRHRTPVAEQSAEIRLPLFIYLLTADFYARTFGEYDASSCHETYFLDSHSAIFSPLISGLLPSAPHG